MFYVNWDCTISFCWSYVATILNVHTATFCRDTRNLVSVSIFNISFLLLLFSSLWWRIPVWYSWIFPNDTFKEDIRWHLKDISQKVMKVVSKLNYGLFWFPVGSTRIIAHYFLHYIFRILINLLFVKVVQDMPLVHSTPLCSLGNLTHKWQLHISCLSVWKPQKGFFFIAQGWWRYMCSFWRAWCVCL